MLTFCFSGFVLCIVSARILFDCKIRPFLRKNDAVVKSNYSTIFMSEDIETYGSYGGSAAVYSLIKWSMTGMYVFAVFSFIFWVKQCQGESEQMRDIIKMESGRRYDNLFDDPPMADESE